MTSGLRAVWYALFAASLATTTSAGIAADEVAPEVSAKKRPARFDFCDVQVTPEDARQAQSQWAEYFNRPVEWSNSQEQKFSLIPPGEFQMGRAPTKPDLFDKVPGTFRFLNADETSLDEDQHSVLLTKAIYVGQTEVTRGEFLRYLKANPHHRKMLTMGHLEIFSGDADKPFVESTTASIEDFGWKQDDSHPMSNISWRDANLYCQWLTEKERAEGLLREDESYRLPTEAEWEYACRAGTATRFHTGDDPEALARAANVCFRTPDAFDGFSFTSPVRSFPANAFGLFDMHGNVEEWCEDVFKCYSVTPVANVDPLNTEGHRLDEFGANRVVRGGSFAGEVFHLRASARAYDGEPLHVCHRGFRLVRDISQPSAMPKLTAHELKLPQLEDTGTFAPFELFIGTDADVDDQPKAYRVSAEEALAMGERLMKAVAKGDEGTANHLFDLEAHCRLAARNLGVIHTEVSRSELAIAKDKQMRIFEVWCDNSRNAMNYEVLRTRVRDGRRTLVVRADTTDGSLTHFELYLMRDRSGKVRVEDVYLFATGFMMSTLTRDIVLKQCGPNELNNVPRGQLKMTRAKVDEYRERVAQGLMSVRLMLAGRRPRPAVAIDHLLGIKSTLNVETSASRDARIMAVQVGEQVSPRHLLVATRQFRTVYPGDPAAATFSIMPLLEAEEFEDALAAIETLDRALGGDPYLACVKAKAFVGLGKLDKAEELLIQATKDEPDLPLPWLELATVQCQRKDFAGATQTVRETMERFPKMPFEAYRDEEEFPGLFRSEEFRPFRTEMLEKLGEKDSEIDDRKPRQRGRSRRSKDESKSPDGETNNE